MAVIKWNPLQDLYDVQKDVNRMFRRAFGSGGVMAEGMSDWLRQARFVPALDVFTRGTDMVIRVELPGVSVEDVNVSITNNILTISGERKTEEEVSEKDIYMMETSFGKFKRSLNLPKEVKADEVKASFKNGILEITVPQAAKPEKEKKVEIEVEEAA